MKRTLAITLALIMLAAAATAAAKNGSADATQNVAISPQITLTSSDASDAAEWLTARLGEVPDCVVVGTDADGYGVDVSALEDDGYFIRALGGEVALFARTAEGLDRAVRKYAKCVERGDTVADETYHEGARIKKLTVAGRDISEYAIEVRESGAEHGAYRQEWVRKNAASALSGLIAFATGVTLPVPAAVGESGADAPRFVFELVGGSADFEQSDFIYEVAEDGTVTFTYSDITGAKYAMTMFLQNELGWQDISFGDDYLPEANEIDVPAGTRNETHPMFDYGVLPYNSYNPPSVAFKNTLRDKVNGGLYNTFYRIPGCGHGMYRWMNAGYDTWSQICYTDENIYGQVVDTVYTYITDQLDSGAVIGETLLNIDLGQFDCFGYCECQNCIKVKAKENNANSGPVIRWMNRLAAEMEDEGFFGLKYTVFAYHGSNVPCVTRCRDDVWVTYCTDGHCSRHFFDGSQCKWSTFDMFGALGSAYTSLNNNDYYEFLRGWCDICDHVYVWFYALDLNMHQMTVVEQIFEDFKAISALGAKAVFWQAPYHGLGITKIEQQLVMYMNLHPDMTKEDYRDELIRMLAKTYGDGWAEVLEYLDLWEEAEMNVKGCWKCWKFGGDMDFEQIDGPTYLANWDRMIECLEAAIPKAASAREQASCEMLTVAMYNLGCYYAYFPAYVAGDADRLAVIAERYGLMIKRLRDNGFDITAISGVDNITSSIEEDVNRMAWTRWVSDFELFCPDVDPDSLDVPAEWKN